MVCIDLIISLDRFAHSLVNRCAKNDKNQRCASKSPRCSRALTLSWPLFVNRKKSPEAGKMFFFEIFFVVAHILIETKLFCFYQIFISSAVQRNHWGTSKSVTSTTNDERRTNERTNDERTNERRTTNYIDDDNSPPGFFQNPRANKTYYNINIRLNNSLLQKLKKLNHGVYHGYRSYK